MSKTRAPKNPKETHTCDFCGRWAPWSGGPHTFEHLPGLSQPVRFRFCTMRCKELWDSDGGHRDVWLDIWEIQLLMEAKTRWDRKLL